MDEYNGFNWTNFFIWLVIVLIGALIYSWKKFKKYLKFKKEINN